MRGRVAGGKVDRGGAICGRLGRSMSLAWVPRLPLCAHSRSVRLAQFAPGAAGVADLLPRTRAVAPNFHVTRVCASCTKKRSQSIRRAGRCASLRDVFLEEK